MAAVRTWEASGNFAAGGGQQAAICFLMNTSDAHPVGLVEGRGTCLPFDASHQHRLLTILRINLPRQFLPTLVQLYYTE